MEGHETYFFLNRSCIIDLFMLRNKWGITTPFINVKVLVGYQSV